MKELETFVEIIEDAHKKDGFFDKVKNELEKDREKEQPFKHEPTCLIYLCWCKGKK